MGDILKKHRVIGILHTLRQLKDAGLVDEDSLRPTDAVADVQTEVVSTAKTWYKVGAKRGGLEILEAFLNGDIEVVTRPDGKRQLIARTECIRWSKTLKVQVGNGIKRVLEREYNLTIKELGFE